VDISNTFDEVALSRVAYISKKETIFTRECPLQLLGQL